MGPRAIVIVLSDFFGDLNRLEAAIQRLRFSHHEVILLQVLSHDELTFPLQGMVKFVGLEIPDHLLVNSSDLQQAYLEAFGRFQSRLDDIAQRNAADRMVMDTSRDIGETLVQYISRRATWTRSSRRSGIQANRARWLPPTRGGK
jgi:hypothetical protein